MSKRLKIVISLIFFVIIMMITNTVNAAATAEVTETSYRGVTIKITSDEVIENVKIYAERGNRFVLIYQAYPNEKITYCNISKYKLSTTENTNLRVIVNDDGNATITKKEIKVKEIPSTPTKQPTPTVTPSNTPNVPATPTSTPSATPASPSPSNNIPRPTSTPSNSPIPSPTTTPLPGIVDPTAVKLSKNSLSLKMGKTETLTATVSPSDARPILIWSTSNKNVATISAKGVVTAVGPGTATIKIRTHNGKEDICKVTVTSPVSSSTKPKSAKGDGYSQTITLGGRTFKLYKQGAGSYAGRHFNSLSNKSKSGKVGNMGCGPAAAAIILSGYGYKLNPGDIGKKFLNNSTPSSMASMNKEIKNLGMTVKFHPYSSNYTQSYNDMRNALLKGHQILIFVGACAPKNAWINFTFSGAHFISVLGIDSSNNKVYVGNSGRKSSGWFDLSTLVKARGFKNLKNMNGWLEIYK